MNPDHHSPWIFYAVICYALFVLYNIAKRTMARQSLYVHIVSYITACMGIIVLAQMYKGKIACDNVRTIIICECVIFTVIFVTALFLRPPNPRRDSR